MESRNRISTLVAQLASELRMSEEDSPAPTLGHLFSHYISHARAHFKTWRNMERCYTSYLSHWHDVPLRDLKRADLKEWHTALAQSVSATTANRALELLRAIINKAIDSELIPDYNPAARITRFRLQPRDRFLSAEELSRLFAALNTLRYDTTRDALLISLLTGQRRGNVVAMRWDEVDFSQATWHIPITKNGTSHIVPLVPEVMAILDQRRARSKSPWVFPSTRSPSGHLKKPELAWRAVVKRAGIKNIRIHDLRRTLASYQAITGSNISVIAWTLNHKDLESTQIYARLNVEPVRQSMQAATKFMLEQSGVIMPAKERTGDLRTLGPAFRLNKEDRLLSESRAAALLGISVSKLQQMRFKNEGPPYIKLGISVKYEANTLRSWNRGREIRR